MLLAALEELPPGALRSAVVGGDDEVVETEAEERFTPHAEQPDRGVVGIHVPPLVVRDHHGLERAVEEGLELAMRRGERLLGTLAFDELADVSPDRRDGAQKRRVRRKRHA